MRAGLLLLAAGALLVAPACAREAPGCEIPDRLPRPMLEGPTADAPRRLMPVGGYTLAVSWSPQYCARRMTSPRDHLQCGGGMGRFGFILHGLWPEGRGGAWPQYCAPTRLVPDKILRENLCSMPSVQLIQHAWEKHGTCMAKTPAEYFAKSEPLYRALQFPDMAGLSGKTLTAAAFAERFAVANTGMRADQLRLRLDRQGWLEEVLICLDRRFERQTCPGHLAGAASGMIVRIR